MSKKANTTFIGAFVLGAITIIVLTFVLLGSGRLFSSPDVYVAYFQGSVQGLRVGANVTFRGVRIGQVREVLVHYNSKNNSFELPVILEIDPNSFRTVSGKELRTTVSQNFVENSIEEGLRAQLQLESFVTGQLFIDLDFYPNSALEYHNEIQAYEEIPTIPSDIQLALNTFEDILNRLDDLPLEEILSNVNQIISNLVVLTESASLADTLNGINRIVNQPETQHLSKNLQQVISNMDATLITAQQLITQMDRSVDSTSEQLNHSLTQVEAFMSEAQLTLFEMRGVLGDERLRYDISRALNEFSEASRSFRILVEYLEQHPEALIKGKSVTD